jgi:hypothetical protein
MLKLKGKDKGKEGTMDWLISLPAIIVLLTCPLMILLMVDGLKRDYSRRTARAREPHEGRVLMMKRPKERGQEADHPSKKAA